LAGSLIGGLTTFAAAWITQRRQANVQWLLQEKTRRQELYQQFIEEASKLYVDALIHDQLLVACQVSRCLLLVEFALAALKIAINRWNSTFLMPLISGIWCR
jgi:hypothetical protein